MCHHSFTLTPLAAMRETEDLRCNNNRRCRSQSTNALQTTEQIQISQHSQRRKRVGHGSCTCWMLLVTSTGNQFGYSFESQLFYISMVATLFRVTLVKCVLDCFSTIADEFSSIFQISSDHQTYLMRCFCDTEQRNC